MRNGSRHMHPLNIARIPHWHWRRHDRNSNTAPTRQIPSTQKGRLRAQRHPFHPQTIASGNNSTPNTCGPLQDCSNSGMKKSLLREQIRRRMLGNPLYNYTSITPVRVSYWRIVGAFTIRSDFTVSPESYRMSFRWSAERKDDVAGMVEYGSGWIR